MQQTTLTSCPAKPSPGKTHVTDNAPSKRAEHYQSQSSFADVCHMLGIDASNSMQCESRTFTHMHIKEGQILYHTGQVLESLYVVNSGFVKLVQDDNHGAESILSFPMKGDLIGIDALSQSVYQSTCIALTDATVVSIPYKVLKQLMTLHPNLADEMLKLMSRYVVDQQQLTTMINTLSAEARVARFIVNMSARFGALGYSSREFALRMTRLEIGAHLGLTLETVSRTLSLLRDCGYIDVDQRNITVNDSEALRMLKRTPVKKKMVKQTPLSSQPTKTSGAFWATSTLSPTIANPTGALA